MKCNKIIYKEQKIMNIIKSSFSIEVCAKNLDMKVITHEDKVLIYCKSEYASVHRRACIETESYKKIKVTV